MLSLPVFDHVESLQGADDVFCCDARLVAAGIAIASSCILAFIGLISSTVATNALMQLFTC